MAFKPFPLVTPKGGFFGYRGHDGGRQYIRNIEPKPGTSLKASRGAEYLLPAVFVTGEPEPHKKKKAKYVRKPITQSKINAGYAKWLHERGWSYRRVAEYLGVARRWVEDVVNEYYHKDARPVEPPNWLAAPPHRK